MRVALYVRVSTNEQAEEGYSIKAQIERLNAYATSQDWKVTKTYIDDGESAKNLDRTNLKRLLDDVKLDLFDCVLVYRLDRFTRSVLDLYTLLNYLEEHNVKFKSATEVYDTTTAMGRLFITLVAALAQWERENLGERVRMGMSQKAMEGKWTVSTIPFGFDKKDKDTIIVNETEAAVVRDIFNMYASGRYGATKIAKILNLRNIKTKSGATWTDTTIRYILRNKIYIGTMRYNYRVNKENYFEVENVVSPIVSKEIFEQVQFILNKRTINHPRRATSPYIFSGIAKCSRCGVFLSGKQGGTIKHGNLSYQYYCRNSKIGNCDLPQISQNFLEIQFIKLIKEWKYQYLIDAEIQKTAPPVDNTEKINSLRKELAQIDERRTKWQYAWINELISDEDLKNRNEEEDHAERIILEEIKKLSENNDMVFNNEALIEALNSLEENWSKLETYEKKRGIGMLVKELSVDKVFKKAVPESVRITNIDFL
ncbi:recombinase family protein [Lysinibacillus halotolerans]